MEIKTKSYTYVLPMLGELRPYYGPQLANVFIGDEDRPQYTNHIFVLFRFSAQRWFIALEGQLQQHPHFVESYDTDKYHVMFVFAVPKEHQVNYNRYMEGKYSLMDEWYKDKILTFHFGSPSKGKDTAIQGVLYREERMYVQWEVAIGTTIPRSLEISSLPDLESEVYKPWRKVVDSIEAHAERLKEKEIDEERGL